jgi:hypothetical protein
MDISAFQALCDIPVSDMICGRPLDADIMPELLHASEIPFSWDPLMPAREEAPLVDLDATVLGPAAETATFKLIYELVRGDQSHWKPYIDMIPSLSEYEEYSVLLWSAESKREWMTNGTALHIAVYEQFVASLVHASSVQNYLCRRFGGIASPLMRRLLCDNSLLRWASVALATRAWSDVEWGTCLIPFADSFNHGSDRNSLLPMYGDSPQDRLKKNGAMTSAGIYTGRDYKMGDEMTQTYSLTSTHLSLFMWGSFTPREGYFIVENPDYESMRKVGPTALNYSKDLECWIETPRIHYNEDAAGEASCDVSTALLTCYRLRRSRNPRRTKEIMSNYRKRNRKTKELAAGQRNRCPWWYDAVYFSTDGKWKAPVPVKVKTADRAAIADLLRDIHRHHSLLRTTGAADLALSEHGATRALRNIGVFRVNERRAIEYCMAAVSRHLDRIDALAVGRGDPKRRGVTGDRRERVDGDVNVGMDSVSSCGLNALQGQAVCKETSSSTKKEKRRKHIGKKTKKAKKDKSLKSKRKKTSSSGSWS